MGFKEKSQQIDKIRSTRSTDALNTSTSRYWPVGSCNVVLVGDAKVGKSNLINRATQDKFNENYFKTSSSGERTQWNHTFSGRSVRYNIIDTNGSHIAGSISKSSSSLSLSAASGTGWSNNYNPHNYNQTYHHVDTTHSKKRAKIYGCADVFMLCYRISDPASLFSALNYWCQEVRYHSPNSPIILVGCQSDLRSDRELCALLGKRGQAPVSVEQGISLSQQIGCVMYVETTSRFNRQSVLSAFEIAALAALGQITTKPFVHPIPPPPALATANPPRSINYNMAMSNAHSVNILPGVESDQGRHVGVAPCLTSPPPIPPKPQINNVPVQAKSKFEFNSDGRRNTSIVSNSDGQSFPPRKAISTIALNHEASWNQKPSLDSHPLKVINHDSIPKAFSSINTKLHHPSLPPKPPFDKFDKENYYSPFIMNPNENSKPDIHQTPHSNNSLLAKSEQYKPHGIQYSKHSQQLHPFKKTFIDTSVMSNHYERNVNSLKVRKNSEDTSTPLSSSVSQYNLDLHQKDKVVAKSKSRFLSGSRSQLIAQSPKLSFKTTRDRSMSSLLSIGSQRTPKVPRKSSSSANTSSNSNNSNSSFTPNEKTVTIRCQRINPDKNNTFEEVDVEVPAPIFETLRFYNGNSAPQNSLSDKPQNFQNSDLPLNKCKESNERSSMLASKSRQHGIRHIEADGGKQSSSLAAKIRSIFGR